MRRADLLANERTIAATYRREAAARRGRSPALAARLEEWATAADRRAEEIEFGPLFRERESQAPAPSQLETANG